MACSRFALIANRALRIDHQLIRKLFVLSVSCHVWNPVKASINQRMQKHDQNKSPYSVAMTNYCTKVAIPVVEYAEVKDLPNHLEKLLIDVREPSEVKALGLIPTAINIPLGIVGQELASNISSTEFQKKYGRPKPDANTYIIMQCRSGKRSQNAAEIATTLGYKNVHNYVGSWLDWADREGLPKE